MVANPAASPARREERTWDPEGSPPDYPRNESRAHQLDRNWAELVQELRVIGTGVQILFAFLLSIAFQARFNQTSAFQRDLYLGTLLLSALAAALLIAPVAMHRQLFHTRVKDELVAITNVVSLVGLGVLSVSMIGAVVLISDWVSGGLAAVLCGAGAVIVFGTLWFAIPSMLRRAIKERETPGRELTPGRGHPQA